MSERFRIPGSIIPREPRAFRDGRWIPLAVAANELGTSVRGAYAFIAQGQLPSARGPNGELVVPAWAVARVQWQQMAARRAAMRPSAVTRAWSAARRFFARRLGR